MRTKTRFDKNGVVYVQLRDTWFRIEGDEGKPIPEGFDTTALLTAEELQAHLKGQVADLSAESTKQDHPSRSLTLELGKKYRTRGGSIVTIVKDDGSAVYRYYGSNGFWYEIDGRSSSHDQNSPHDIVSLAENGASGVHKKNPPFAVGQVWRMRNGEESTIFQLKESRVGHFVEGCSRMYAFADGKVDTTDDERDFDLVEYLRDTEQLRIEVGKKYHTRSGGIVEITHEDDSWRPFCTEGEEDYAQFSAGANDPIVALVEDEPRQEDESHGKPLIVVGREYLRSDGKRTIVVSSIKSEHDEVQFVDQYGTPFAQFSRCNNITIDKELPTAGDEVSYFCQDSGKWSSGWIVRGTCAEGVKTFLTPKYAKPDDHKNFGVGTEHIRIDVRSWLPPVQIGDLWRRRSGELLAIKEDEMAGGRMPFEDDSNEDLVAYLGKSMPICGRTVAKFAIIDDAVSFINSQAIHSKRHLMLVRNSAEKNDSRWCVHEVTFIPEPSVTK